MSHESTSRLLIQLSTAQTPLEEYLVTQNIMKMKQCVGQLVLWKGWHCQPQATSVIGPMLTGDHSDELALVVSWFNKNSNQLDPHCKSERHCSCHTVSLLSALPMDNELLSGFDHLLSVSCVPRRECFHTACLIAMHDMMIGTNVMQDREQSMRRLLKLRTSLPRNGSNFVGEANASTSSPSVRWFILTLLKIVATETKDKSWCDSQLVYLRDMIAEITGDSETKNQFTKQIIRVFGDEDVKLISVTKSMICIMRDISDVSAADDMFKELAEAIHYDHSVLVDWLTSDDETAVQLLSLLVTYLKLPNDGMSQSVRNLLIQLRETCVRLTARNLIPYNSEPLLRLMRKL